MSLLDPTSWRSGELIRATKLNEMVAAIRAINARLSRRELPPRVTGGGEGVFPVTMSQTGGSDGTNSTAASWTYTVTHALTGKELGTNVNPVNSPHKYARPAVGKMSAATYGLAHYNTDNQLVVTWINEVLGGAQACT